MVKLAKIIDNKIVYSNTIQVLIVDDVKIINPQQTDFRKAGFKQLPTIEHGDDQYVYYVIENNQIVAKVAKKYVPPIKYSKLKIIINTEEEGVQWTTIEDWMKTNNLYSKWLAAQEISSDYPGFNDIINTVKQAFPNINVDRILTKSILIG